MKKKENKKLTDEPQHEQLFGKKEKKVDVNMHKYKSYGWDLHVDMHKIRAQQLYPQKQKLDYDELKKLTEAKDQKLEELK